jgi:hypothetical protein
MSKRKAFSLGDSISQQQKFDKRHASVSSSSSGRPGNPFQKHPIFLPEKVSFINVFSKWHLLVTPTPGTCIWIENIEF